MIANFLGTLNKSLKSTIQAHKAAVRSWKVADDRVEDMWWSLVRTDA